MNAIPTVALKQRIGMPVFILGFPFGRLGIPVVCAVTFASGRRAQDGSTAPAPVPLFLVGFVILMVLNSLGWGPESVVSGAGDVSRWCLAMAIAAIGIKTSFAALASSGWRPVVLMVIETVWLALLVLFVVCIFQFGW